MPQYTKSGNSYRVSYITGPQHILLGLFFGERQNTNLVLSSLGVAGKCNHGVLDPERIKKSVIKGVAEVNASFGTNYIVSKIEYIENDSPNYELFSHCAFLLAKGLHEGIEFKITNVE